MAFHPREGRPLGRSSPPPWDRTLSRRDVLRYSAGSLIAAKLLVACGEASETGARTGGSGDGGIKIGTPENPVEQPIFDDNPPIESGLEPEPGPLRLYNWADYIWPRVLKDFSDEFGVEYELTTFYNLEEATRKLQTGDVSFDVFFPTAEIIPKYVAGKLLQPLNHDYLPNLTANVWPRLTDPHYDVGSRYTVPYTVYLTGMGWRADMAQIDPASLENPWEILADPAVRGQVGLYDDYRETLGVGIYLTGSDEINSGDPELLGEARDALIKLGASQDIRYTIDGAYAKMPEGKFALHHAWSGDVVGAQYYFPKGQDASVLRFLWPPEASGSTAGGYVSNDSIGILGNAEHPVLAHMFLNYMLDNKHSLKNFGWLGYQPPLTSLKAGSLVSDGYVPASVENAIITQDDFSKGQIPIQLDPTADAAWLKTWSEVQAG
jgi:spermidine/putrescine transport system substrate-binding protein